MKFNSMFEFKKWLQGRNFFAFGSQGTCYRVQNKVFKIFNQYVDDFGIDLVSYTRDDILKFSSVANNTYSWPTDIITVNDEIVGYVMEYINGNELSNVDPLQLDLNNFNNELENVVNDIKIISDNGILSYDVAYNILYNNVELKVIDTMEYSFSSLDNLELFRINSKRFFYGIDMFLFDGYFDKFILSDRLLSSAKKDLEVDFLTFLKIFRTKLSENEGFEVLKLKDAVKSINITSEKKYIRNLNIKKF